MLHFLRAFARTRDPITSDLAAERVHVEHVEMMIVHDLREAVAGMTCVELARSCGLPRGLIESRGRPLETKGLIYRDGTRRVRGSRSATTVWKAVGVADKNSLK